MSKRTQVDRIYKDPVFRMEVESLVSRDEHDARDVEKEVRNRLKEIATKPQPFYVQLFSRFSRWVLKRGYTLPILTDQQELENLRSVSQDHALVFLITHKTYLDILVLFHFLVREKFKAPRPLGGDNMLFFGFGTLVLKAGCIAIRRSFRDDDYYRVALRGYLAHLLGNRHNLMWAIEGTRSRTGKLLSPKLGLLKYV